MRTFSKAVTLIGLLLSIWCLPVQAQTLLNNTTLNGAINASQNAIVVTAVPTGLAANDIVFVPGLPGFQGQATTAESMRVTQIVSASAGQLIVARGQDGTRASAHASGVRVFIDKANRFQNAPPDTGAACTRNTIQYLPWVDLHSGISWSCSGGTAPNFSSSPGVWYGGSVAVLAYNSVPLVQFYRDPPESVFAGLLRALWAW